MHRVPRYLLLFVLAPLACGEAGAGSGVVVRDSAGVAVLTIPEDAAVPEWPAPEEPELIIGEAAGPSEYELYDAVDGFLLEDGRIILANRGSRELRLYDEAGRHLKSVGREGGGPGEFESLSAVAWIPGDTLAAWDWSAKRLTLYDDSLGLIRVLTPDSDGGLFPRLAGAFDDGTFALVAGHDFMALAQAGSGVREDSILLLRIDMASGAIVDSLGPYPGQQSYLEMGEGQMWIRGLPFGREEWVAAAAGRLFAGDDRTGEVKVYGPRGRMQRVVRMAHDPAPVAREDIERYRQEALADVEADRLAEERRRLDRLPAAGTLPAFDHMFVDRSGRIWLQEPASRTEDARRWTVLDSSGRPAGRLTLPAGDSPLDAGPDYVLIHSRDALDVERVLLLRIPAAP
jgi:hypothetical protein